MKDSKVWIGLCAVVALSGCATGLLFVVEGAGCGAVPMRGEKVAAVVMVNDDSIRLAGEEALARELSVRGAAGVPMYTLLAGAHPDEAKARAAERAGVVGVVVLRPVRVDKEISSRPTYSGVMVMDGGFWGGYYGHGWGSARSAGKFVPTPSSSSRRSCIRYIRTSSWSGQSKTTNPANLNRLIENTAKQVGDELVRQGLITKEG